MLLGLKEQRRSTDSLRRQVDGDLDVVVSLMDARPAVLWNESASRAWVRLELLGGRSNRPAVGAVVDVHAGGRVIHRQLKGGGSFSYS